MLSALLLTVDCLRLSELLPSSHFRFKGLPPEDAAWIRGCGFCQPARQQHSHGGWVIPHQTSEGAGRGLGQGQCMLLCKLRRWEILTGPLPSLDWWPLPLTKGVCLSVRVCARRPLTHTQTHTHIFQVIWQFCLSSCPLFQFTTLPLAFSRPLWDLCFPQGLSPSPPCSSEAGLSAPPRGKLVYFWAGLTRYKPYCALYSFNSLVLPFPHIYLMSQIISFTYFQFPP